MGCSSAHSLAANARLPKNCGPNMINSKKHLTPPCGVFTERNFDGHPGARAEVDNSDSVLFIFFCGKENEPKETALVPGPFGLPCASRSRRALWNSLALKQPQGLYRRPLQCSARDDGTKNASPKNRFVPQKLKLRRANLCGVRRTCARRSEFEIKRNAEIGFLRE